MAILRGIGRVTPVLAAGLAAGWYLRRQGLLGAPPAPELPPAPEPAPPRPAPEPEPEPQSEEPLEAHVEAVEAVSDAADVTAVVEDLLAAAPEEEDRIVDAEVVDEGAPDLAETVRLRLAEVPGLLAESLRIESSGGVVWLRGELERPEAIAEAERLAASVSGVAEVRNLLHLPGTPPPKS